GSNPNYAVTKVDSTLTINQRPARVGADAKANSYGDANPALTAVVSGTVNGDTLNFTLATTALQFSNVGGYPITVTLGSNPNYAGTEDHRAGKNNKRPGTAESDAKTENRGDGDSCVT